jgi:opacity protein-like surface antigen
LNRAKSLVLIFGCLLLLAESTSAQAFSTGNVFGGYSYLSSNLASNSWSGLNGWNSSVEVKPFRYFGFVADFSGYYGTERVLAELTNCTPTPAVCLINSQINQHNFLFGLRGSGWIGKFRPSAEVMIGATRLHESRAPFSYLDLVLSEAIGAGVDYRVSRRVGLRLQFDYLQTIILGGVRVNDARASMGPVFYF